ncbi:hypothetical protein DFQ30_009034, partial [Apophysomyces sp. BC1015]
MRVIEVSLSNTCRSKSFVQCVIECVKHANFYLTRPLSASNEIPPITHQLSYQLFAIATSESRNVEKSLKDAYANFKQCISNFNEDKFKSKGFMSIVSRAAKDYDE